MSSVPTLLLPSTQIISALDDDRGGYSGYLDLREVYGVTSCIVNNMIGPDMVFL